MANIALRAYYREIEELISQGRIEEVIAHCRQILKFFPKDVTVYRLLAKAYLESQRYSDATDIFQRVLSVLPDDFVSHVGMSIIREDEGNMDASIWHMERAFEVQPSNAAIRDELRRLFGKRDGMEPPKVRLTRGALARMYSQGNLYQQSINELRAALTDEPQRFDLQVLLGQMYLMNGQKVEAAEISNLLISKLPFCLEANRILSQILAESGREAEAQDYFQRVQVLDPYTTQTSAANPDPETVADNAVSVVRLEWKPGQPVTEMDSQPDWASSLGINLEDTRKSQDELPDWLEEQEPEEIEDPFAEFGPPPTSADSQEVRMADKPAFEPDDAEELPSDQRETVPPESLDEETPEAEDLIPDWMKDAGWATASGDSELEAESESQVPLSSPDAEEEDDLAAAEIPEWLQDIAPQESPAAAAPISAGDEEMSGEIPSWLSTRPPGPTDSVVMWLKNKPDETDEPPSTGPIESPDEEAMEEEVPDWLQSVAGSIPAVQESAEETPPEFTEPAIEEPEVTEEDTQPRRVPSASEDEEALAAEPAMVAEPEAEPEASFEPPATTDEDLPDWLKEMEQGEDIPAGPEPSLTPTGEIPDWLQSKEDVVDFTAEDLEPSGEAIPSWMDSPETEPTPQPAASEEAAQEGKLPDWLKEMEQETGTVYTPPVGERAMEPQEPAKDPEPSFEELPDWLRGVGEPAPIAEAPAQEEEELPWEQEEAAAEAVEAQEADLPAWLHDKPDLAPAAPLEGEVDEELAFEGAEMPSLEDQDAAIAWLESLAAKQGVAEEELVTDPQARREAPPEWVTKSLSGEETLEIPEEELVESVRPAEKLPDQPDWMTETLIGDTFIGPPETQEPEAETPWSMETLEPAPEAEAELPWDVEEAAPAEEEIAEAVEPEEAWSMETLEPAPEAEAELPWDVEEAAPAEEEIAEAVEPEEAWSMETLESSTLDGEALPWETQTTRPLGEEALEEPQPAMETGDTDWMLETALPEEFLEEEAPEPVAEEKPDEALPEPVTTRELDDEWMLETALPGELEAETLIPEVGQEVPPEGEPVEAYDTLEAVPEDAPQMMTEPEQERAEAGEEWMIDTALPETEAEAEWQPEPMAEAEAAQPADLLPPEETPEIAPEEPVAAPVAPPTEAETPLVRPDTGLLHAENLRLAQGHMKEGQVQDALKLYNQLVRRRRHLDQVIEDLQNAMYSHPVDTDLLETLGDAYVRSHRLQDALDTYTKAEELLR